MPERPVNNLRNTHSNGGAGTDLGVTGIAAADASATAAGAETMTAITGRTTAGAGATTASTRTVAAGSKTTEETVPVCLLIII